jgi:hypothetical protein
MNAGTDYTQALRQAQANANRDGQPRMIGLYNGVWWIDRYNGTVPPGWAIVQPTKTAQT